MATTHPILAFSVAPLSFSRTALTPRTSRRLLVNFFRQQPLTNKAVRFQSRHRCSVAQASSSQAEQVLFRAASDGALHSTQVQSLLKLADLVLDVNKQFNLTAIRTRDAVIVKHIVDALSLLPTLEKEQPSRIIDVGSGAGFPGLVLAIARPDWHITLLDSARKKTRFHEIAWEKLGLTNVDSVWARAEEAGQDVTHRQRYQVAIARSVAEMRVLSELCLPLVSLNGCFIAQKSVDSSQEEILGARFAMKTLGGTLEAIDTAWPMEWMEGTDSDDDDMREKSLVIVRKDRKTPAKYPRLPGTPKKSPL